jgi:CRP-like cAMP-binding protein
MDVRKCRSMTLPTELENELYAGLPEAVRQELDVHDKAETVARGTRLVEKGVIPQGLIILNSGTAEITLYVAGKERSIGVAGPGKVFALNSIMTGTVPETTVTCLEECRVTIVSRDLFLEALERHPEMYFAVVKVLSADLAKANSLIRECARGFQPKPSSVVRPA